MVTEDKPVKCIVDLCGNFRNPGHAADIFERPDGSRYIGFTGAWRFYHPTAPEFIEATDPRFTGFVVAAEAGEDIAFIKANF